MGMWMSLISAPLFANRWSRARVCVCVCVCNWLESLELIILIGSLWPSLCPALDQALWFGIHCSSYYNFFCPAHLQHHSSVLAYAHELHGPSNIICHRCCYMSIGKTDPAQSLRPVDIMSMRVCVCVRAWDVFVCVLLTVHFLPCGLQLLVLLFVCLRRSF